MPMTVQFALTLVGNINIIGIISSVIASNISIISISSIISSSANN